MRHSLVIFCIIFCIPCVAKDISYNINSLFSISVSDLLELRKEQDVYTRLLNNTIYCNGEKPIVFQQRDLSVINKEALSHYCRILIITDNNGNGEYSSCNEDSFEQSDIDEFILLANQELAPGQSFVVSPIASVEKNSKGNVYIRVHYIRTGTKGNVCVDMCFFFNYDFATKIIFSFRLSEASIWKEIIDNAMNSIEWIKPYYAETLEVEYYSPEAINSDNNSESDILLGVVIGVICTLIVVLLFILIKSQSEKILRNKVLTAINTIDYECDLKHFIKAKRLLNETIRFIPNSDVELREKLFKCQTLLEEKTEIVQHQIYNIIRKANEASSKADIEKADELLNKVYSRIELSELPDSSRYALNLQKEKQEKEYIKGLVADKTLSYVKYEFPNNQFLDNKYYTQVLFPKKGNVVFPYRRRKVALRGYTEDIFQQKLITALQAFSCYKVIGDASVLPQGGYHPYEPDIAVVEVTPLNGIRIDIEIDEPYSGYDKTPIHYIGCGDNFRDMNMVNLGWIVIRFSEKQVFREPSACIAFVKHIISLLDPSIEELPYVSPMKDKRWTFVESQMMAARQYRERMLNHQFGHKETEDITFNDVILSDIEKEAVNIIPPLLFNTPKYINIDNSSDTFCQDSLLAFIPDEHVYVFRGSIEFRPVSSVVSSFFAPFDTLRWSSHVARKESRNQLEVIEDWNAKGMESRDIGTFLHAQIEAYLMHKSVKTSTRFQYKGEYVNIDKMVSIETELQYFQRFISENKIRPFRAEWHIYDEAHKIAGTIDLLCKNGQKYDIYDWKRSRKALPTEDVWKYGINGMEKVPDIKFYHYALQQNMYKYILEKNYGITIGSMYLVILHPIYQHYQKIKLPEMTLELKTMLRTLN